MPQPTTPRNPSGRLGFIPHPSNARPPEGQIDSRFSVSMRRGRRAGRVVCSVGEGAYPRIGVVRAVGGCTDEVVKVGLREGQPVERGTRWRQRAQVVLQEEVDGVPVGDQLRPESAEGLRVAAAPDGDEQRPHFDARLRGRAGADWAHARRSL